MAVLKMAVLIAEGAATALGILLGAAVMYSASLGVEAWLALRKAVLGTG